MSPVLAEAKRYIYLYGTVTDTTIEPIELIRDLTAQLEKYEGKPPKKPKANSAR